MGTCHRQLALQLAKFYLSSKGLPYDVGTSFVQLSLTVASSRGCRALIIKIPIDIRSTRLLFLFICLSYLTIRFYRPFIYSGTAISFTRAKLLTRLQRLPATPLQGTRLSPQSEILVGKTIRKYLVRT